MSFRISDPPPAPSVVFPTGKRLAEATRMIHCCDLNVCAAEPSPDKLAEIALNTGLPHYIIRACLAEIPVFPDNDFQTVTDVIDMLQAEPPAEVLINDVERPDETRVVAVMAAEQCRSLPVDVYLRVIEMKLELQAEMIANAKHDTARCPRTLEEAREAVLRA